MESLDQIKIEAEDQIPDRPDQQFVFSSEGGTFDWKFGLMIVNLSF